MKDNTPEGPKLFSSEWWDLRVNVMQEVADEQARLRVAHPLPGENDRELNDAINARAGAALALAAGGQAAQEDTYILESRFRKTCERHEAVLARAGQCCASHRAKE